MIHNENRDRIILDVVILFCIFLVPSYITFILSGILILKFKNYIEFPIAVFFIDVISKPYGGTQLGLFGISLIILIVAEYFKDRVKMKRKDTL